eukprot:Sro1372_g267130.1 30S Ribosomal protein S1 (372) ;mRNA; r:3552-4667
MASTLTEAPAETQNKAPPKAAAAPAQRRRRAKNKQFLMKKWKAEQASAKTAKKRKAAREKDSQFVSAVGLTVSKIQDKATKSKKKTTAKQKTPQKSSKVVEKGKGKSNRNIANNSNKRKDKAPPKKDGKLSWTKLVPGSKVSGTVVKKLPYGVLVQTEYDVPGRTPGCVFLHNNQMADSVKGNGKDSAETKGMSVGSQVKNARVITVNREKGTVNVSLEARSTKRMISKQVSSSPRVGDEVEGKVVRLQQYGAFIDIGYNRNALLHISRMTMYKVLNIADHVKVGQTVKVRILRASNDSKDIAVSMLSKENDAFVDRRELQSKRMVLWQQVVNSANGEDLERTKRELLEIDRLIWDQFLAPKDAGPRSMEV